MAIPRSKKRARRPEERRAPRFKGKFAIRLSLLDGSELKNIAEVKDVSESGMQFSCRGFVKKNARIKITINMGRKKEPLVLVGRVVWVETVLLLTGVRRVGVSFLEVTEEARRIIRRLGKKNWWKWN